MGSNPFFYPQKNVNNAFSSSSYYFYKILRHRNKLANYYDTWCLTYHCYLTLLRKNAHTVATMSSVYLLEHVKLGAIKIFKRLKFMVSL
jgi:hypothetical protein